MGRGASFHLKPVVSPADCQIHNRREWTTDHPQPGYILGGPHWSAIEGGDVVKIHGQKMALASGKARSMAEYSPVWDGVLNLDPDLRQSVLDDQVKTFGREYERISGHKVISAQIHLDEGRIEDGKRKINAHAHLTVDRTDDAGRPIRLDKDQLRQVQDAAAVVTGLERGDDASETRLKHLPHRSYKALARSGNRQQLSLF